MWWLFWHSPTTWWKLIQLEWMEKRILGRAIRLKSHAIRPDPSCHACGAPVEIGETVAIYHAVCDQHRHGSIG